MSLLFVAPPKTYKLLGAAILRPSGFQFSSEIDSNEDNGSIGFLGIFNGTWLCEILDLVVTVGRDIAARRLTMCGTMASAFSFLRDCLLRALL
jgi:hypothetical protein